MRQCPIQAVALKPAIIVIHHHHHHHCQHHNYDSDRKNFLWKSLLEFWCLYVNFIEKHFIHNILRHYGIPSVQISLQQLCNKLAQHWASLVDTQPSTDMPFAAKAQFIYCNILIVLLSFYIFVSFLHINTALFDVCIFVFQYFWVFCTSALLYFLNCIAMHCASLVDSQPSSAPNYRTDFLSTIACLRVHHCQVVVVVVHHYQVVAVVVHHCQVVVVVESTIVKARN